MKFKLLTLALCMFCGMSFLAANEKVEAETTPTEEVAVADEVANLETAKAKKAVEDEKAVAQGEKSKSCCGCK